MTVLPQTIDSDVFRTTLGCFATGVVVITSTVDKTPVGLVVNSFTSVSLSPPLVLFCVGNGSTTWPFIRRAGRFCANILSAGQEAVARRFSGPGDRYTDTAYSIGPGGTPILDGVHASIECVITDEYAAGDHMIVIGQVLYLDANPDMAPLLFYRSRFHDGTILTRDLS